MLFRMLALFFTFVFFLACSDSSDKDSKNYAKNYAADTIPTLKVGLNAEYPPFEFKKDGKITGFDVDLLDMISKKAGFKYTLHHMSFDGLIPALKAGKIDMIMSSMSATSEREKQVDFSIPYYEGITLYIKQKSNAELIDKDSIKGKRVGVFLGTVQEQAANRMKGEYSLNVIPSDSIFGAIMNLKNGKVDVVLADGATALGYLKENAELTEFYSEGDGSNGLSIALDKGKHSELLVKIDKAIKEIKESDKYYELLDKYGLLVHYRVQK